MNDNNDIIGKLPDIWKMRDSIFYTEIIKPLSHKVVKTRSNGYEILELDTRFKISKNQKKEILSRMNKYKENLKFSHSNLGILFSIFIGILALFITVTFSFISTSKEYIKDVDEYIHQLDEIEKKYLEEEFNFFDEVNNVKTLFEKRKKTLEDDFKIYKIIYIIIIILIIITAILIINNRIKYWVTEKVSLLLK